MSTVTVTYANGKQVTANVMMCDRVKFDLYRNRNNWPTFSDAPFLGTAFWAHAALFRTGETTKKFEKWLENVAEVTPATEETDEEPFRE